MFKKIIAWALTIALTATAAIGGTLAHLQSQDEAVNVMTLGNVKIDQIEQERAEDGSLQEFTQAKPAFPAVGPIEWADTGVDVNGTTYKVFTDDLQNVVDKIVTVKNTGLSDAYVRTIVAIEAPDYDPNNLIHVNVNGDDVLEKTAWTPVDINGQNYVYSVFTYKAALKPGEISAPSLMQVFLDSKATNEDCEKFGETWEILVVSQAMQTQGFGDAATALNTGFGAADAAYAAGLFAGAEFAAPVVVNSVDDMRTAMKTPNAKIVLGKDIEITDDKGTGYCLYAKFNCEIDMNGYDIIVDMPGKEFYGVIYALNGAKVDIVGEGNVEINGGIGSFVWSTGASGATEININGGNWKQSSADFNSEDYCEGIYANREGVVNIYGGMFQWDTVPQYTANESREGVVNIYGGTFVNFDPRVSHDSDGSYVADGYTVVEETQTNGDVWYTVVPA